jgi:hypothetical protein
MSRAVLVLDVCAFRRSWMSSNWPCTSSPCAVHPVRTSRLRWYLQTTHPQTVPPYRKRKREGRPWRPRVAPMTSFVATPPTTALVADQTAQRACIFARTNEWSLVVRSNTNERHRARIVFVRVLEQTTFRVVFSRGFVWDMWGARVVKNVTRMIGEHNLKFIVDGVLASLAPCQWANEEKYDYHQHPLTGKV